MNAQTLPQDQADEPDQPPPLPRQHDHHADLKTIDENPVIACVLFAGLSAKAQRKIIHLPLKC